MGRGKRGRIRESEESVRGEGVRESAEGERGESEGRVSGW